MRTLIKGKELIDGKGTAIEGAAVLTQRRSKKPPIPEVANHSGNTGGLGT